MSDRRDVRRRFEVDDHESYARPARRTRARTKRRPQHENAVGALVVAIDRGRYTCLLGGPDGTDIAVTAVRSRSMGRTGIVVGDQVRLVGDVSGAPGTLARIVAVQPRRTVLRRTADDDDPVERIVVANADQMVIVVALDRPPPRPRLIDRCLAAAYDADIDPLLCLTKTDLAAPDELLATYRPLGVPSVVASLASAAGREEADGTVEDDGFDGPAGIEGGGIEGGRGEVAEQLRDRISVLVGHSGVGKSTLVNALVPGAAQQTGQVSAATGRGRHTSTRPVMLALPGGGWIVDTPGIRSFGLAHVSADDLLRAFADLEEVAQECPRRCGHGRREPECALDEAVSDGRLDPARVDSYRRLLDSRSSERPGDGAD